MESPLEEIETVHTNPVAVTQRNPKDMHISDSAMDLIGQMDVNE
jgi:hypothetical protein